MDEKPIRECKCGREDKWDTDAKFCPECGEEYIYSERRVESITVTLEGRCEHGGGCITIKELRQLLSEVE